jgi:outer membrane receptor for ferrienterochelin and colicin
MDDSKFISWTIGGSFSLKAFKKKKLGGISALRFGSEYQYAYNPSNYQDTLRKLSDNYFSVFAESDIYITNDLAAKIGGRYEYSSVIKRSDFAPRVSLAYKTGRHAQVSVAYGVFYQKPGNQQLAYSNQLLYQKATHYIVNFQQMTTDRIFRIEAYFKQYDDR